jgi:hypothetical protein
VTGAEDSTDGAARAVACPECGKADFVQKISAIPDWPAEYGPPDKPGWFDLLGVLSLVGAVLLALGLGYVLISVGAEMDVECLGYLILAPLLFGVGRLASKGRQRWKWEEGMRFWKRLYFCPRDEVAFVRGGRSTCPLHEIRDLLRNPGRLRDFARKPERVADFSPMPEEFVDYERMLEEAKDKSETLVCFECGHDNRVGQTQCEDCGAWVPQTAKARWAHAKDSEP